MTLRVELDSALRTQQVVEQQKQENDLLRETIERLHSDLNEIRVAHAATLAASKASSAQEVLLKSFARELAARLKDIPPPEDSDDEEDDTTAVGEDNGEFVEIVITRKVCLQRLIQFARNFLTDLL